MEISWLRFSMKIWGNDIMVIATENWSLYATFQSICSQKQGFNVLRSIYPRHFSEHTLQVYYKRVEPWISIGEQNCGFFYNDCNPICVLKYTPAVSKQFILIAQNLIWPSSYHSNKPHVQFRYIVYGDDKSLECKAKVQLQKRKIIWLKFYWRRSLHVSICYNTKLP